MTEPDHQTESDYQTESDHQAELDHLTESDSPPMTEEELVAFRQGKANRATRGGLAAVLCLEAFVVLLVPRAIAGSTHVSTLATSLLLALAFVMIVTGFLLRRPWGIGLGSLLQVVMAATIALVPAIVVVVVIFFGIWGWLLNIRHQTAGTPSGWRMLIS